MENDEWTIAMDTKALAALKKSIRKWEQIVAGRAYSKGPENCPLCKLFWIPIPGGVGGLAPESCIGCPVYEDTGEPGCIGTPYEDYENDNTQENAEAELEYLRSLLPAEQSDRK